MKNLKVIIASSLMGVLAYAAEHGAESAVGHSGIPKSVFYQTLNLGLLFVLFAFLFRGGKFAAFFKNRKQEYLNKLTKAQKIQDEANKKSQEIRARLQKLEAGATASIQRAQTEAEGLRKEMIREASIQADQIKAEARRTAEVEIDRAREQIRVELISKSISASRENIQKSMASQDQKRLQEEFIERLSVVR